MPGGGPWALGDTGSHGTALREGLPRWKGRSREAGAVVQARAGCVGRESAVKCGRAGIWVYLGESASMVSSRLRCVARGPQGSQG